MKSASTEHHSNTDQLFSSKEFYFIWDKNKNVEIKLLKTCLVLFNDNEVRIIYDLFIRTWYVNTILASINLLILPTQKLVTDFINVSNEK